MTGSKAVKKVYNWAISKASAMAAYWVQLIDGCAEGAQMALG